MDVNNSKFMSTKDINNSKRHSGFVLPLPLKSISFVLLFPILMKISRDRRSVYSGRRWGVVAPNAVCPTEFRLQFRIPRKGSESEYHRSHVYCYMLDNKLVFLLIALL